MPSYAIEYFFLYTKLDDDAALKAEWFSRMLQSLARRC